MKAPSTGKKSGANAPACVDLVPFPNPFPRPARRDLTRAPLTRARTRATVCRTESCLRRLARTRVGSRSGLSGRTRRRYTFTSQHSANHHRDGFHVFQEGVAFVFRAMSEHVGDRKGSAPFKEGTIKYACYEVLKHAGPRGLTVRPRVLFPARASLPPRATPPPNSRSVALRRGVEFSSLPSVPSFARQVTEIVHHIRDGGLAKLGGATPANTIVVQLSKGTRAFLLPSQRSPREKECVHPSRTDRAWLTYYSYPTSRLRRRRQLLARV